MLPVCQWLKPVSVAKYTGSPQQTMHLLKQIETRERY